MRSPLTTLCYVEKDDSYLMLHRVSKKHDVNKDKWIGIGGHFEEGESPEECLLREAMEETGLRLTSFRFRAIVTFIADGWPPEYMCLYTADGFEGELTDCNEGKLEWVKKAEVTKLKLWEGDKIFLKLIAEEAPFFSLKLMYQGDVLKEAVLDGKPLELFDICDTDGKPTGETTERSVAHTLGTVHRRGPPGDSGGDGGAYRIFGQRDGQLYLWCGSGSGLCSECGNADGTKARYVFTKKKVMGEIT